MEYTREDVRKILAGLARGPVKRRRIMTDAEFEARYDPRKVYEDRSLAALEEIRQALSAK